MPLDYAGTYKAPGVYILEAETRQTPVESVPSAILGVIGFVKSAGEATTDLAAGEPVSVTSLRDFGEKFMEKGRLRPTSYMASALIGFFQNGGKQAHVLPIEVKDGVSIDETLLAKQAEAWPVALSKVLEHSQDLEEITILIFPDLMLVNDDKNHAAQVQRVLIDHCSSMKNRIAILDAPDSEPSSIAAVGDDWFKALGEAPTARGDAASAAPSDPKLYLSYAAVYYPWIKVPAGNAWAAPAPGNADSRGGIAVPPSGHVAGLIARVDRDRGVHRAPANEIVLGAVGTSRRVTREHQEQLNPKGVNCIRSFPGQGILVWGARTLSKSDAWRYVNVRRLFCHIQDSIQKSTRWVVFEPNNNILWAALRRDLEAYLTTRWREGALLGKSPQEAFFVKCDEETNPEALRNQGFCTVEVGLAAVRPAEFLVIRIGHWEGGTKVTEASDKKPEANGTKTEANGTKPQANEPAKSTDPQKRDSQGA